MSHQSNGDLSARITALTAEVAKLLEADAAQRDLIIRVKRYLHAGVADPVRMLRILHDIETVLGTDGVVLGERRSPNGEKLGRPRGAHHRRVAS